MGTERNPNCPGMATIESTDLPTPPDTGKTIEELAKISEEIKDEKEIPSWEWTEYIYKTILPHIDELHEAGALYEVKYEDADPDCYQDGFIYTGFRNKSNGKKEGWGCCIDDTVSTTDPMRNCSTFVDGKQNGLNLLFSPSASPSA